MKYCSKCGKQLFDEAVICTGCGCSVETEIYVQARERSGERSGLKLATKILMILGTIMTGFWLIPLAWCIPLTISYFNKVRNGEPITTGFKVCCLLFVSLIGGILMLCDNDT